MKNLNLIIKIILLVIFLISSCQSLMQIERNAGDRIYGSYHESSFRYSEDHFSNPLKNQDFCTRRNAACETSDCSKCKCKGGSKDTFLSYEQGCLNYTTTYNILQESSCMKGSFYDYSIASTIPLVSIYWLGITDTCYYPMKLPEIMNRIGQCYENELVYFDSMYGKKKKFRKQYHRVFVIGHLRHSNDLCLMCSSGINCNSLNDLKGYILRLSIKCYAAFVGYNPIETCFTFILNGDNELDQDATTTTLPVIPRVDKNGTLHVQYEHFNSSNDIFTNKDRQPKFCSEFDAVCQYSGDCANCRCKRDKKTFISYRYGCLNLRKTQDTLGLNNCVMVKGYADDIICIQKETFKYGTCINLKLPSTLSGNQDAWSCEIKSTKYINALNGAEESTRNPFTVKFSSIFKKNLCLQCISFACDLSMYSGMMIKLEIKCKKDITSSQIIDTCFAFKLDGQQSFNETDEETKRNLQKWGMLEVVRNNSELMGTQDFFTNPKNDKEFCLKRSSVCESTECLKCKCFPKSQTFISYNNGCLNINKENDEYELLKCLQSETDLVQTSDFNRKRCLYLEKPRNHKFWSCDVDSMSYIEPVKGKETEIAGNIPFQIISSKVDNYNNKFCLQCKSYACDVSYLSGRLLKLGIKCHFHKNFPTNTCIVLKMEGKYATNATLSGVAPFNTKKTDDGSSSSVIAGVIISVLLILIAIVAFIFIWRWKQNQKKSDNNFIAFHSERSDTENASVRASRPEQPLPMRTEPTHEELSAYLKSARRSTDINGLSLLDSPENRVQEGNIWTAAENSTSSSKEMTTENVVPETKCDEENIHTFATDGVGNPIYGMVAVSNGPECSSVDNDMSDEEDSYCNLSSLPVITRRC